MGNTPGPREQQLRTMRAGKPAFRGKDPSRELAEMTAAAIGHPPLNAPADAAAQPKETTMPTATAKKKAPKSKPAKKGKTARKTPAKAPGKAAKRAVPREGGIRPGSKLALVVGLLKRPEGCTTDDVLQACNWPSVSMPQMAKAAGLTLTKHKEKGSPTVYRAA